MYAQLYQSSQKMFPGKSGSFKVGYVSQYFSHLGSSWENSRKEKVNHMTRHIEYLKLQQFVYELKVGIPIWFEVVVNN